MKIITAPEEYSLKENDISVFLAGGITNCPNWQEYVIKNLVHDDCSVFDNLVIFNPRRENFPIHDPSASYNQIAWEYKYLEKVDIFSMYFCSGESDQPICMYELGRNIVRMQNKFPDDWKDRLVISVEAGYKRRNDVLIQTELISKDITINKMTDENASTDMLKDWHSHDIISAYYKIVNGY